MRSLQSEELDRLQSNQASSLMDAGKIYTYSDGATDSYGLPAPSYTAGSAIACGYKSRSTREVQQGNETITVDAELRLTHGTTITSKDRFELTKRYGEALSPTLMFYVIGLPAIGPSGVVVNLKRVTDE